MKGKLAQSLELEQQQRLERNTLRPLTAQSEGTRLVSRSQTRTRSEKQRSLFEISQDVCSTHRIPVTDEYRSVAQANLITGDNEQGRKKERELNVSHVSVKTSESWRRLVTIWRLF